MAIPVGTGGGFAPPPFAAFSGGVAMSFDSEREVAGQAQVFGVLRSVGSIDSEREVAGAGAAVWCTQECGGKPF
jgi:hypothetical protein